MILMHGEWVAGRAAEAWYRKNSERNRKRRLAYKRDRVLVRAVGKRKKRAKAAEAK